MTPRVVVVGDAMLDVVVRPSASVAPTSDTPSRVRVGRGGAAANLAVAIASADPGLEVVYVAAVGDDAAGELGGALAGGAARRASGWTRSGRAGDLPGVAARAPGQIQDRAAGGEYTDALQIDARRAA